MGGNGKGNKMSNGKTPGFPRIRGHEGVVKKGAGKIKGKEGG